MATLPVRRGGRNLTPVNPSREFEDIYDRMGQLMNAAFGGFGPVAMIDMPWSPLADVSETDDAYVVRVDLPCSPCYFRRLRQCPNDHACMKQVSAEMVIERVRAVLNERGEMSLAG